jgi:hypothetical protein
MRPTVAILIHSRENIGDLACAIADTGWADPLRTSRLTKHPQRHETASTPHMFKALMAANVDTKELVALELQQDSVFDEPDVVLGT